MTRFHFSIPKVVSKYFSEKDNTSNYTAIILIGAIILLLGVYFVVAYSFLETSSSLLMDDSSFLAKNIDTCDKETNHFFSLYKTRINDTTFMDDKANDIFPISIFFENCLELNPKNLPSLMSRSMPCISEKIIETDFSKSFQKNNKTVS